MNKTELIAAVAEDVGVGKKDTEQVLNAFFSTVQETLKQNDKVQIPGFGSFEVRERAARTGRNPHTGETIEIAAAKVLAFKPEKGLKDAIQYNTVPSQSFICEGTFCCTQAFLQIRKVDSSATAESASNRTIFEPL